MGKPVTYDRLKSKKKAIVRSCWIALDPEIADEDSLAKLKLDAATIRMKGSPENKEFAEAFAEAEAAYTAAHKALVGEAVKFKFKALGRRRYQELLDDNKPTDEQRAEARRLAEAIGEEDGELGWNPDTFPDQLIAKCLIEPELSKEEILNILGDDNWSTAEVLLLFNTAMGANSNVPLVDLGKESGRTSSSTRN